MVLCLSLAMVTSLECNWLELLRVGPAPHVSLSFSLSLFFSRSLSETRQEQGCLVRHAFLSLFFLVFCMYLNDNGTYCSCTSDWLNSLTLKIHSGFGVLQITLCFVPFCAQFWIGLCAFIFLSVEMCCWISNLSVSLLLLFWFGRNLVRF